MESQSSHSTPPPSHRPHAGGREDCWSEGATEALLEAWGDRYLQLDRGNLRQRDWVDVAGAVNSRQNGVKPQRTDIQCKNRIDTLKKKFKLEKSKPSRSKWRFYSRLRNLLNTSASPPLYKKSSPTGKYERNPIADRNAFVFCSAGSDESSGNDHIAKGMETTRLKNVEFLEEETTAYRELARAILRFGEIYERIESAKQQELMELERQRMELTKEMEFERMSMFLEALLRIEKMKRRQLKYASGSGKKVVTLP